MLTNTLITFNFKFNSDQTLNKEIFDSFSTSCWLDKKHWFIKYNDRCVFSIPHFAPELLGMSTNTTFDTTSSESTLIYCHVNTITWRQHELNLDHYFIDTKTLNMKIACTIQDLDIED
ncbi:unnamed protein product [Adineta ricciae]|uniref:Uncharacterized protein n=1 Tax=Adineta ricciae TaxID=249248 RepID=A0A815IGW3_ADIRI|nr:unnamed protein product [Adineta ricciae]CAF1474669.1 unnamed protein product [Adineta ricciae]